MRRAFCLIIFSLTFCEINPSPAAELAQQLGPLKKDTPVLFKADQLRHERKLGIVVGQGNFAGDFTRTFTSDRDLKPTDTVFVRITFKNLGEVGSAVGP